MNHIRFFGKIEVLRDTPTDSRNNSDVNIGLKREKGRKNKRKGRSPQLVLMEIIEEGTFW